MSTDRQRFRRGSAYTGTLLWAAVLAVAWLLWSGLYSPLLLLLGAASCLITVYLVRRLDFASGQSVLRLLPRLPRFWLWLVGEIVRSSIEVARIVLHPRLPVSPAIVEVDARALDATGQAILGNAIILTPGTLTLDVFDGRLRVHCLTQSGARELRSGEMLRRVERLVGGSEAG